MTAINTFSIFHRQYPVYLSAEYSEAMGLSTTHERLAWARKKAGYSSAADFARECDVPVATYTSNENGTRGFKNDRAQLYARKLGVRFDWLVRGVGDPFASNKDSIIEAPILAPVSAGKLDLDVMADEDRGTIPIQYPHSKIAFIPVEGESMNRLASPGDMVLLDFKRTELVDGKFYIFRHDNLFSFKRYRSDPDRFEPYSTGDFDTIFPKEGFEVVGEAKMVIRQL